MAADEQAVFRVVIRGTLQQVWREITKTDELQKCFFNMQLETTGLQPGAQIRMRSPNGKHTAIAGEVLEFDPPYRYVHTFRFTQFDEPACIVSHELKEVPGGVEYTLTHRQLTPGSKTAKQMQQGGAMICNTLKAVVETGRPGFGVRMLHLLFRLLGPLTPARCRSEHWPLDQQV